MSSCEDRSATGSYSFSDESRDQMCGREDNFDSCSELAQETRKIKLSDNSHDSNYFSLDSTDRKPGNSSAMEIKPSFINSYAQTNDIRYLLAPFWKSLLLPNEDGDT